MKNVLLKQRKNGLNLIRLIAFSTVALFPTAAMAAGNPQAQLESKLTSLFTGIFILLLKIVPFIGLLVIIWNYIYYRVSTDPYVKAEKRKIMKKTVISTLIATFLLVIAISSYGWVMRKILG
ncbi:hypothetical protein NDK43_26035 [Neobacillus pocheonensis]|uniref:Uncharacterized protein n=1 Tax=Neobacillus pocheonensis TaxID=363869 RepID=A0ABT0WGJ3_9BACI|nr:hypothetical protein [Neobacillus pocheonensis]